MKAQGEQRSKREEWDAFRMFERKIVKICTSVKEGETWRIIINKEARGVQGADIVKLMKSLRLRCCGHVRRR
jgi:hypothetical protein